MPIRPTFVVALGGAGTNAVMHLRSRLALRYGTADFPTLRYLFLDTDTTNNTAFTEFRDSAFPLSVSKEKVDRLRDQASAEARALRLTSWMYQELKRDLNTQAFATEGVLGVRQYGRLALLAATQLPEIRNYILGTLRVLNGLRDGDAAGGAGDGRPREVGTRILVAASAGGGTGSGTFLDMGYFLKQLIAESHLGNACHTEGIAAIAVADNFPSRKKAQNSLALMQEWEYFSRGENIFDARFVANDLPREIGTHRPYDYPFLVSPTAGDAILDEDAGIAMEKLEAKMGDFLFLRVIDEGGQNGVGARMPDMAASFSVPTFRDGLNYPLSFLTFGVTLRQIPTGLMEKREKRRVIATFLRSWLQAINDLKEPLNASDFEKNRTLANHLAADYEYLLKQTGLLADGEIPKAGTLARKVHGDELAHQLMQTGSKPSLEEALTRAIINQNVDTMFEEGNSTQLQSDRSGYIAGIIAQNSLRIQGKPHKLDVHSDYTLETSIYETIWAAVTDSARGPRYAMYLIDMLVAGIKKDQSLYQRVIDTPPPPKSDMWRYANFRVKMELLVAKKTIHNELVARLCDGKTGLKARTSFLVQYLAAWEEHANRDTAADNETYANARRKLAGVLDIPQRDEQQLRGLVARIDLKVLQDLFSLLKSDTFRPTLPQKDNRDDFSIFAALEAKITALLAQDADFPPTVLEQMGRDNHGVWGGEARRILNESRPALNLNLNINDYHDGLAQGQLHDVFRWFVMLNPNQGRAEQGGDAFANYRAALNDLLPEYEGLMLGASRVLDWGAGFQDRDLLAMVALRGSFPTRAIVNYAVEGPREGLIDPDRDLVYTQKGIKPPPGPEELKRAKTTLLVVEILSRCSNAEKPCIENPGDGLTHIYYVPPIHQPIVGEDKWPFTKTFPVAATDLAEDPKVMSAMEWDIQEVLDQRQNKGVLREFFNGHLVNLRDVGRQEGAGVGIYLDLNTVNYAEARELLQAWVDVHVGGPNAPLWAKLDDDGEWRCKNKNCKTSYGGRQPDFPACQQCGHRG